MHELEREMNDELLAEYKKVERIIYHQPSEDKVDEDGNFTTEYLVKWNCLPYSECTWEEETLIKRQYKDAIDEYFARSEATTIPTKGHSVRFSVSL